MRRAHLTRYLTLREAAELVGMGAGRTSARKLGRLLRKKERRTSAEILFRLGDSPNSPVVTTIPVLRQHCPELFDTREEALEIVREYVEKLKESVAELRQVDRSLAARIRANTEAINAALGRTKVCQRGPRRAIG